jgi:biopolymer transport protein ExbB/TolQ
MSEGKAWKGAVLVMVPILASSIYGLFTMKADIALGQKDADSNADDIQELTDDMDDYEDALKVLPEIKARLDAIDRTQKEANAIHKEFLQYMRESAVEDAKNHHVHNGTRYQ